jgi:hypothetical protein
MKHKLFSLCGFEWNRKLTLLYRGSLHGYKASDFHSKCDGISKTLTIIKAAASGNIFGGYTEATWNGNDQWKSDRNAFIFSLVNSENQPVKVNISNGEEQYAIYSHPNHGPVFGGGYDIHISDNSNTSNGSFSDFGASYVHQNYTYESVNARRFLAGSFKFNVEEIEVFQIK